MMRRCGRGFLFRKAALIAGPVIRKKSLRENYSLQISVPEGRLHTCPN